MSAGNIAYVGDTVYTGWLIKSPPEKKLQRFAWRKRWFILRQGRMSGNPDVLEYYRNKQANKPKGVIDLRGCEVWKHDGPGFVRKEFQDNFVFIVKTISRMFYLVAKTEEEMDVWIDSITQICKSSHLEIGADLMESLSLKPSFQSSSIYSSLDTPYDFDSSFQKSEPSTKSEDTDETSQSEFTLHHGYLMLPNCSSGSPHYDRLPARSKSWTNSDHSSEQSSSPHHCVKPQQYYNLIRPASCGSGSQEALSTRSQTALSWNTYVNVLPMDHNSAPLYETSLSSTIQVDKNQGSLSHRAKEQHMIPPMPPPRRPKPPELCERCQKEQLQWTRSLRLKKSEYTVAPRVTSACGFDTMLTSCADVEGQSLREQDNRLSLTLPHSRSRKYSAASSDGDGDVDDDGYVPMGPGIIASILKSIQKTDDCVPRTSKSYLNRPLPALPENPEPPTVNRDLKPRRKPKPPPLDLKGISTILGHASPTGTYTLPRNQRRPCSSERSDFKSATLSAKSVSRKEEGNCIQMKPYVKSNSPKQTKSSLDYLGLDLGSMSAAHTATKSALDYLALDFSSMPASCIPKKVVSKDERVKYAEVDRQKTQALQSTKQEWTDERHYKV